MEDRRQKDRASVGNRESKDKFMNRWNRIGERGDYWSSKSKTGVPQRGKRARVSVI